MITENQNSQVSNNDAQPASDAHQNADSIHVIEYKPQDPWWFNVIMATFTYLLLVFVLPTQLAGADRDTLALIDSISRLAIPISLIWFTPTILNKLKQFRQTKVTPA